VLTLISNELHIPTMDNDGTWYLALTWAIVSYPVKIAWVPFSSLIGVVLFFLSPIIYMVQFGFGLFQGVISFIISLEV
jgi:hypothetical protein